MSKSDANNVPGKNRMPKVVGAALLLTLAGSVVFWNFFRGEGHSGGGDDFVDIPTHTVDRGDLSVTVSAGGSIQALNTTKVECEVEGNPQILEIVPQGEILTEEDVANEKVIVRLDSSSMEDKEQQQELDVANAEASFKSAQENLNIQKQENESNVSKAKLDVQFARMDLEKYVGKELAPLVIEGSVDYASIGDHEKLGGEARVKNDNFESEISLANEELTRAEDTLKWTRRLVDEGYVNRNEQDADELQRKSRKSNLRQARDNLRLFLEYTLPKQVEQYASDFSEAKRELERVKARSRSQLAQAESELRTKKSTFNMKRKRLQELQTMIDNCRITAPKPGLVVYASTSDWRGRNNNPIEAGRNLREGETIITIPDLSTMAAEIEVTEGDIKRVAKGQRAEVSVDAISGKTWAGEVVSVSTMASSQQRFGPDVRVYDTVVKLDGQATDLKPGMSTTAEIYIAELEDILTVPVQAVTTFRGDRVVWVENAGTLSLREIRIGQFSDTRVEIRAGLSPGDKVLLAAPDVAPSDVRFVQILGEKETGVKDALKEFDDVPE